ncbi:hypothetical protein SAMN02927937_01957 [Paenimyroides aquimaris]|uniref:Uncharacterized protein n=1 Tax=Paenimyroides marinum TaxID=1159016 RepID=A0A1H6LJV7_9FLAO|nr:hypothetical protein [Paenimyroides aquimaris]SEH88769.1 hypothetical protein SAMN02927937_01957 [Paenimyroides aquimaris]
MKKYITIMMVLFSLWCNAQIEGTHEEKVECIIPPVLKEDGEYKNLFDYAIKEKDYTMLIILIENDPQGVIDEIEKDSSFSYSIFKEIPLSVKVDKALEAIENNPLKGSIYKDLKKVFKKHIKKQKINYAS